MSRSAQSPGPIMGSFAVYDEDNEPVTGLVDGDFEKLMALNGVDSAVPVTIAEIGEGRYSYQFTATEGYWFVLIRESEHAPRGFQDEYDVSAS